MARTPRNRREPRAMVTPEERDLFLEAVTGAVPLSGADRTPLAPPPRPTPTAAVVMREPDLPPTTALVVDSSGENVSARSAGVSHAQLSELRNGRVRPEATIDLHGRTAADAEAALRRFLVDAAQHRRRCVLVIHGRGLHSGGIAVVRDTVLASLVGPLSGLLHSFATAVPRDGGGGATYVVLRG